MPRAKIFGFISIIIALVFGSYFTYYTFFNAIGYNAKELIRLPASSYYALAIPIVFVSFSFISIGFWVGWTILTIKVVAPMPEIVEKKDYAKIKASFLCLFALAIAIMFIYGIYIRNYWALAIPSAIITLVILGMIFWVGVAIITTRSTLPENKKNSDDKVSS